MMQNINFYQAALRKQAAKFSALAMVQAGAAVTVAVLVIYGFSLWQISALRAQVRDADQQRELAARRFADASQRLSTESPSGGEDVQIQLEKDLLAHQKLQRIVQAEGLDNTAGYSAFFVALARRNVPGMWLTRFEISDHGKTLLLEGRSSTPDLVPRYLQNLAQEPHFSGTEFKLFQIVRPDVAEQRGGDNYVEFRVGTTGADDSSQATGAGT